MKCNKDRAEWILRTSLFLRYGVDIIDTKKLPTALVSWRVVAQIMKQPYEKILSMKRKFFGEGKPKPKVTKRITRSALKNISPYPATRVSMTNITEEEIEFLTNRETIREWSPYSLLFRCNLFHRRFPDRRISAKILRKVMLSMGFKKKVIKVVNAP